MSMSIESDSDISAITLLGSNDSSDENIMTFNGDTVMTLTGKTAVEGVFITDGKQGPAKAVFNGNLDLGIEAGGLAYGIYHGTSYGFNVFPDGSPNGGSIKIDGALNLDIDSQTRAGGVISGSWFGVNGYGAGDVSFGKSGLKNSIVLQGGEIDSANLPGQDKMVGLLAYSEYEDSQSKIAVHGSTSIVINSEKTLNPNSINNGTFGVYAAYNSKIEFLDENESLSIDLTSSSVKRRLDGIAAGLYDFLNPNTSSSIAVNQKNTDLIFRTGATAWGIESYAGADISLTTNLKIQAYDVDAMVGLFASRYLTNNYSSSYNQKGGTIDLTGGYSFFIPEGAKASESRWKAISADGSYQLDGYKASINVDASGEVSQIEGGVYAVYGGQVDLTLDGADSYLLGHVDQRASMTNANTAASGNINLTLKNGAAWRNLDYLIYSSNYADDPEFGDGYSTANRLTMAGGILDMSTAPVSGWQRSSYQKIALKELAGASGMANNGKFIFDMNLADEVNESVQEDYLKLNVDQLIIEGQATGTYEAAINFVNGLAGVDPNKAYSENWIISQGADSDMTINMANGAQAISGRGMVSQWMLRFVEEGGAANLADNAYREGLTNHGVGEGDWYLLRYNKEELPPEIDDNIAIANSASMAFAYVADLDDLRKRLGEVRYGSQDGLWAKTFVNQNRINGSNNGGFKQNIWGINIGFDKLFSANEESAWLLGGAFRYSDADQKRLGNEYTTGSLEEYSAKLYGTWMSKSGFYSDIVLQLGRYEQEISGFDNTGIGKSNADYGTWGYGASLEVGHMFAFGEEVDDRQWFNHYFIEPQLQLAYFHALGESYTTSTGLKVDQDNADFLIGRAGFVLGKKFNYGTIDDLDKRYFQIAFIGGIKHEFIGGDQYISYTGIDNVSMKVKTRDLEGIRFYYGLNADWQIDAKWRLYAQIDCEKGDSFTEDYDASVGFKYSF